MKIKKLEIHNFRGLSDVIIDNLDPHLNLLMGVNGAGKSSVLDAIALLLQSFTARLTTSAGKGISIGNSDVKRKAQGCKLFIELDNGVCWSRYKFRRLERSESGDLTSLLEHTRPLRILLDENRPTNLPVIIHYSVNRAVTGMMLNTFNRLRLVTEDEGKPSDSYKNWWNRGAIYRDFFLWFKEEEAEENRMRLNNLNYRDRGLNALRKAVSIIFQEYSEMEMINRFEIGLKKGEDTFLLSQLSDGEKCYITLVCDIVRRLAIANPIGEILDGEGIVLIDEVDLHLHPSWEATVMPKLHEVFPNIQFIVSAHSPLVASHFDGQVYGVDKGNVTLLPRLLGLNYSTILQDWMMADSENKNLKILADLYRTYKDYNMEEQANEVWQKIIKATNGDVTSPYFLNLLQK